MALIPPTSPVGYEAELKAKKILYRGTFGTQKEGGFLANFLDLRRKNVANTNVVYWGKRLLALWEGGLPHLMDPITLQTYGTSRLAQVLKPSQNLCAHPRYDPATNRYVFFSADPDPRSTMLTCYEFDDQFRCVCVAGWVGFGGGGYGEAIKQLLDVYVTNNHHVRMHDPTRQAGEAARGEAAGLLPDARHGHHPGVLRLLQGARLHQPAQVAPGPGGRRFLHQVRTVGM